MAFVDSNWEPRGKYTMSLYLYKRFNVPHAVDQRWWNIRQNAILFNKKYIKKKK